MTYSPDRTNFAPELHIPNGTMEIDFYKQFGASEHFCLRNEDGSIHVAELELDGAIFHVHETMRDALEPVSAKGVTAVIGLFVPDVELVMEKAIQAGAVEINRQQIMSMDTGRECSGIRSGIIGKYRKRSELILVLPAILLTVVLLGWYVQSRWPIILKFLAGLWLVMMVMYALLTLFAHLRQPIRLTRHQIIGNYRIDTTFYSGPNARWQYKHYRFTITPDDSLVFYKALNDSLVKISRHAIGYSPGPPDLWHLRDDQTHQVLLNPPTLYRAHSKFYYVFTSRLYGNMFFRRID